jgi:hypothetical protein
MDFTCDECGKYHWIPLENSGKQEVIDKLEDFVDNYVRHDWFRAWFEHNEPELMARFRTVLNQRLNNHA